MAKLEFKTRRCDVLDDGFASADLVGLGEDYEQDWEVVGMTALPPGTSVLVLLKRPVPTKVELIN